MNQLTFSFAVTNVNGWPKLRFMIDNDVHLEHEFSQTTESITLLYDIDDGKHLLQIERYGKKDHNMIFNSNNIQQDQTVELQDIFFNNIKLPDYFKYSGCFNYHGKSEPGSLFWGPNGIFEVSFEMPFVSWIINQQKQKQDVIDLFNYNKKDLLIKKIEEFKKVIVHG